MSALHLQSCFLWKPHTFRAASCQSLTFSESLPVSAPHRQNFFLCVSFDHSEMLSVCASCHLGNLPVNTSHPSELLPVKSTSFGAASCVSPTLLQSHFLCVPHSLECCRLELQDFSLNTDQEAGQGSRFMESKNLNEARPRRHLESPSVSLGSIYLSGWLIYALFTNSSLCLDP